MINHNKEKTLESSVILRISSNYELMLYTYLSFPVEVDIEK